MKVLFCLAVLCATWISPSIARSTNNRIVGGEDFTIEQVPYQASLIYNDNHWCGAVLLRQNFAITAAHCFDVPDFNNFREVYRIRVGSTYINREGIVATLIDVTLHPQFDVDTYNFDVAVIQICDCFTWTERIQPIALPAANQHTPEGSLGLVTGWGRLWYQGPIPDILQGAEMPILNRDRCLETYAQINPITDSMFCAGSFYGGLDSCHGDSGGPMVFNGEVIGLVSWGIACAQVDFPGVYTNISFLRPWIDQQLP
ncbi:vitellin-degrading protease-like [Phlebotomus papatasi]|uniref:vitellin-degrading protease-like n=1 Tax=Phlebotomus papatasi TaxID=29031 RepID=UPI002483FF4B|nr:vitellin-degrading protease-like [Phlebotomus papatasi]